MEIGKLFIKILCFVVIDAVVVKNGNINNFNDETEVFTEGKDNERVNENLDDVFSGVYTECLLHLSYSCLQNKTLLYLKELNNLSEVSVFGDYVKFVKLNASEIGDVKEDNSSGESSDELAYMIDKAIDHFFDNHVIKFNGLSTEISVSNNGEEFVGRKKRKGGGGGGHGGGDDDGGKKKMMMMAMMCMKMKVMMMVPAMMGMMGMMSFKGMMFSMMSFMVSKMMLLMKILEKKGGAGGSAGGLGGGDGGWAASGGGGGAWMPAGGQDYAGGGYDANGQWQSRSIFEKEKIINKPIISYVDPIVRYSGNIDEAIPYYDTKIINKVSKDGKTKLRLKRNIETVINDDDSKDYKLEGPIGEYNNKKLKLRATNLDTESLKDEFKANKKEIVTKANDVYNVDLHNKRSKRDTNLNTELNINSRNERKKRSLLDAIQNSYIYWVNQVLGLTSNRRTSNTPKYRIVNGIKYVYYPFRKFRAPKDNKVKIVDDGVKIITAEDFNKGEIMEGGVESRMNKKKFHKMKDTVNDTIDENPWE